MGCKRYDGCIICILFQISWQLQTQIVKNRIRSDSLLGNKLYYVEKHAICLKDYGIRSFLSIRYVHGDLCKHLEIDSGTDLNILILKNGLIL